VVNYTKAIELEEDFSEAYFNRALTYLLLNQPDKAISDLSKAGELGVYKAYSILKKLQNQ
jgi:tetratricopeptide (TPR) repeat protein